MNQIYKIAWIGLAINVLTYFVLLVVIKVAGEGYFALSYQEQHLVAKLSIFNVLMLIFILLEVVNLFVILKAPKYAKISSFITSCFFPFGAVYFIGCLLSIQRVALSPFYEYQYQTGNIIPHSAIYFFRDRYWKRMCILGCITLVMPIKGVNSICMMMTAMHCLSYRKTEGRYFFAETEGGFLLTPTALSKTLFLPYRCIKGVEEREGNVLISVNLNKKINIVFSKKFVARDDLTKVIKLLSQAALNNPNDSIVTF
ncbi:membrane protein [Photorhabdus luminescens]|nr:membrane protein [Photorhabdus luminescens]